MKAFVDRIHGNGQHWVPIIDAGTGAQAGSPAFEEGNEKAVWVRNYEGGFYLGQVSAGLQCGKGGGVSQMVEEGYIAI